MADARMILEVEANVAGANTSIKSVNTNLSDFEKQAAKAGEGASRSFNSFESTLGRVKQAILGIGMMELGKQIIGIAADFERARVGMEALTGSAEVGNKLFKDIQAFALKSPFEFKDLLLGSNRLLAMGFAADKVLPTLRAISAAGGALGFDAGKLMDLTNALGQVQSSGRITGETLRELRHAAIPAVEMLGEKFKLTGAQVEDAIEKKMIPGQLAVQALVEGLIEKFGKFDEAVSKTASVALSNLKDAWGQFADAAGGAVLPQVTEVVKGLTSAMVALGESIKANPQNLRDIGVAIAEIGAAYATYKVGGALFGMAAGLDAIGASLVLNPLGLLAVGIAAVAYEMHNFSAEYTKTTLQGKKSPLDLLLSGGVRDTVFYGAAGAGPGGTLATPGADFAAQVMAGQYTPTAAANPYKLIPGKGKGKDLGTFQVLQKYGGIARTRHPSLYSAGEVFAATGDNAPVDQTGESGLQKAQDAGSIEQMRAAAALQDEIQKSALDHQIRMVELTKGPSGELASVQRIYELRVQGAQTQSDIMAATYSKEEAIADMIQKRYQKTFDSLKQGFESVFDALISRSKNLGDVLVSIMKAAIITPVRNWASNAFATAFAPMLGGGGGGSSYGGATAALAGAGGAMGGGGGLPGVTGEAMSGGMGGSAALAGLGSIGAMGGGSSLPGVGTAAAGMGGIFSKTGAIGGLGARAGMSGAAGLGMMGLGAGALGIYGGAKLAGMDSGWAKGAGIGIAGLGGAIAGGSLMAMFPSLVALGMAVPILGAAIGVGIALYMAFGHKSPEQKMIDAVKDAYGISIDKAYAKSLVGRAAGMDYRVFLQRPDIQQEIQLYRQMTKQGGNTALGMDNIARGVNLQESGGSLYQAASYYGGGAYGYQSTLPGTGSFSTLSPTINASFSLDGHATTAALGGAVVSTTSQSQGRTNLAANLNAPLAVTV